jgi:hypothetical protein
MNVCTEHFKRIQEIENQSETVSCPECGSIEVEEHHEEVDIGVGTLKSPSCYLCDKGHVWGGSEEKDIPKLIE